MCTDGKVRLRDGGVSYEGRVEYCHCGVWGPVCDDGWTTEDANVVCSNLEYPNEGEFSTACIRFVFPGLLVSLP